MAEYGAGTKEEHRKGGYHLPDAFYIEAKPDGSGEMSADEKAQLDAMKKDDDPTSPTIETKVVTPKARKGKK